MAANAVGAPCAAGAPAGILGKHRTVGECTNASIKKAALHSGPGSPRTSSAVSSQDAFAPCADAERATSLEVVQAPACPSSWPAELQEQLEGHSRPSYSSRCHPDQREAKAHKHSGAVCTPAQQAALDMAGCAQDTLRDVQKPQLSAAQLRCLRGAQQAELLCTMIRRQQACEQELAPRSGFLEQQEAGQEQAISPQMITIVCSWLSEVAAEFSLQQETLFLAVALLCRFLDSSAGVPRSVLQLVAVTCMMIAAKQEEVRHPSVREFTEIAANCFTAQDLLRMERILLDSLAWRVKSPTAYDFLHLYTQGTAAVRSAGGVQACQAAAADAALAASKPSADPLTGAVVAKAAYLIELAMVDYMMLRFAPSLVAASALYLAESWSFKGAAVDEILAITGYVPSTLAECMDCLVNLHKHADVAEGYETLAPLVFIKEKYAADCWVKASQQPLPPSAGLQGCPGGGVPAAAPPAAFPQPMEL